MSWLERAHPDTPCQPNGAHHPHLMICGGPDDCGCEDDYGDGRGLGPFRSLDCCVCGKEWPCPEKRRHDAQRRASA